MNILIVGAGMLGQVIGAHLASGGGSVSYLVKPAQVAVARTGFQLRRLRRFHPSKPQVFVPQAVYGDIHDLPRSWDAVWLCVQSVSLREPWIAALRRRVGETTVVSIGMGARDRAAIADHWPSQRIVEVFPAVIAFPASLAGRRGDGGQVAFWLPPKPMAVSGDEAHARPVERALKVGGLGAIYSGKVGLAPITAALSMPQEAAAEIAGWNSSTARQSAATALAAAREATTIVSAVLGVPPPSWFDTSPMGAWLMATLFKVLAPFNVDVYRPAHFTKISAQTLQMIDEWVDEGQVRKLPIDALSALRRDLELSHARRTT